MDITRDNYEAWFLDFTDGNLNETQQAKLYVFLEANADLKAEFEEDFDGLTLQAETVMFVPKDDLKKELEVSFVNVANVDYYLIAQVEGLLSQAEKKSLALFLQHNPQYQNDQRLYGKTKLKPNLQIVFDNKKAIKRSIVLIRSLYVRYAAAAAVLLLFIFAGWQILNFDASNLNGFVAVSTENNSNNNRAIQNASESNLASASGDEKQVEEIAASASETKFELPKQDLASSQLAAERPVKNTSKQDAEQIIKKDRHEMPVPVYAMEEASVEEGEAPSSKTDMSNLGNSTSEVLIAMNAVKKENKGETAKETSTKQKDNNLLDYAGKKVKKSVLAQENATDGKLRENDLVAGLTRGLDKVTNANVQFKDKSDKERVSYGFSIGNFEFSRTRTKK